MTIHGRIWTRIRDDAIDARIDRTSARARPRARAWGDRARGRRRRTRPGASDRATSRYGDESAENHDPADRESTNHSHRTASSERLPWDPTAIVCLDPHPTSLTPASPTPIIHSKQNLIFRFLQTKARIQIWLYENTDTVIEGRIIVSTHASSTNTRARPVSTGPARAHDTVDQSFFRVNGSLLASRVTLVCIWISPLSLTFTPRSNPTSSVFPGFRRVHEPRAGRRGGGEQEEGDEEDGRSDLTQG